MDINTSSLLFLQRQKSLATFSSANDFSTATGGPGNWLTATKILACSQSMHRYWAAFTAIVIFKGRKYNQSQLHNSYKAQGI